MDTALSGIDFSKAILDFIENHYEKHIRKTQTIS